MRKVPAAVGLLALLCEVGLVHGARWIGPGSTTGPVERPAPYLQAIAALATQQFDFDDLSPGTNVNGQDLGGLGLVTASAGASIVARTGPVAGAEPGSSPIALLAAGTSSDAAHLDLVPAEPVISVGFVLMGIESWARLRVYGADADILGNYLISPGLPGERRWIGIAEDDRNIWSVQLQPTIPGDYGIDDVELGIHAPEPATLLLSTCIAVPAARRIRRRPQRGSA